MAEGDPVEPAPIVCTVELRKIYDAIMAKTTGKMRSKSRFEDQESEYANVTMDDLYKLYKVFYRQCGAETSLPDLSAAQERGGPAQVIVG